GSSAFIQVDAAIGIMRAKDKANTATCVVWATHPRFKKVRERVDGYVETIPGTRVVDSGRAIGLMGHVRWLVEPRCLLNATPAYPLWACHQFFRNVYQVAIARAKIEW